ncbi:MAG: nuclear transport factor 2 family protein [Planctomycetes bacterium]|nr:nuclear transport factor 2 family protein [Planctomycetota bacterium]
MDRQTVVELLHQAGWAYDTRNVNWLVDLFLPDGQFDLRIQDGDVLSFRGQDRIRNLYVDALASQNDQRRHIITNVFFDSVTSTSMKVKSNVTLIAVTSSVLTVVSTGVYTDQLIKHEDRWRIKHRFEYLDRPF